MINISQCSIINLNEKALNPTYIADGKPRELRVWRWKKSPINTIILVVLINATEVDYITQSTSTSWPLHL